MEHHLEFWPVPLQRGRNRWSRRGCRWNLAGIICLPHMAKSSIFESCWIGRCPLNGAKQAEGKRRPARRKIVRPGGPMASSNLRVGKAQ